MSSFLPGVLVFTPILVTSYMIYMNMTSKKKSLPLPPGPKGWPIVGNIFDVPHEHPWKTYARWCAEYDTDILYLDMAGSPLIIVDTHEAAIDLLDNRSAQYSGRPPLTMVNELMGWEFNVAFLDYGERWRQQRKLFHQEFQSSAVHQFNPQQLRSARTLAFRLKDTRDVMSDVRRMAGEIIISIAYGLDVLPENDPYMEASEISVHALVDALVPGRFLVDFIPIMKYIPHWMPGATFKRQAMEWRKWVNRMQDLPFDALLKSMENGTSKPSFGVHSMQLLRTGVGGVYTEENIKLVSVTIYQAGTDTVMSALSFCILSLVKHPDVAKIAQDEIDSVTDCNRLPNFNDQSLMPYVGALIREAIRYWNLGPLALPHMTRDEDEYKGFRIPAGSVILANVWKMLHNPEIFPDPSTFKPERYLGVDQTRDSHSNSTFGFGRRICPGRHMAYQTIWITMATILSIYDITKPLGPDGKPIEPSYETTATFLVTPKPFQCSFTVRSVASALYSELAANSGEL